MATPQRPAPPPRKTDPKDSQTAGGSRWLIYVLAGLAAILLILFLLGTFDVAEEEVGTELNGDETPVVETNVEDTPPAETVEESATINPPPDEPPADAPGSESELATETETETETEAEADTVIDVDGDAEVEILDDTSN